MDTFICTVGTSALTNTPPPGSRRVALGLSFETRSTLGKPRTFLNQQPFREAAVADYVEVLSRTAVAANRGDEAVVRDLRRQVSAELSSLALLRFMRGGRGLGRVVLVSSDTGPGSIAATIVGEAIEACWPVEELHTELCAGLDPEDQSRFLGTGLQNLQGIVQRNVEKWRDGTVHLNITGGLKGGIPFLTAIGMKHGLPIVYLFDQGLGVTWIDGRVLASQVQGAGDWGSAAKSTSFADMPLG